MESEPEQHDEREKVVSSSSAAAHEKKLLYQVLKNGYKDFRIRLAARRRPRKVVLGSSGHTQVGWIATDIQQLNILREEDFARYFARNSVDAMMAEHVWEHLSAAQAVDAARNCYQYLKRGGYIRVAVPDGFFPDRTYIEQVRPGGSGSGSDDHKALYTHESLGNVFRSCGYEVRLLEYWDEQGAFHHIHWNAEDGNIRRSRWNDERNTTETIQYTSLILDAIKP